MRPKTPHLFVVEDRGYATPCHVWTRATNAGGYGKVRVGDRIELAHRAAYKDVHGPIPDGLELDHLCRVPACVNVEHLEPVTDAVNARRGSATKLTEDDVAAIRAGRADGISNLELAARFGVSASWVSRIISGRTVNRYGVARAWA